MNKYFIIVVLLVIAQFSFAQNPNLGASGAQFLQIPIGAKAESMGGAIIGLTDDASSVFWNPAGIVKVNNFQALFSYIDWFNMFDVNAASVVYNAGDAGAFAASMLVFSTGKMEITTETEPNGTGRFFDAGDLALGISYARYLTDRFNVGASVKYVYQRIWNETAAGVAFDIGTQYRLDFQNLTIAMSMTNFGSDMRYDGPDLDFTYRKDENFPVSRLTPSRLTTEEYPLPLNFQVGIGFDVFEADFIRMKGAIDVTHPNDNKERAHFGTEFSFFDRLYLRGGYKLNYDDQSFAFGAGVNLLWAGNAIYFDYAYSIYDILPSVHRIALRLSF
ncbi:MAG: PorV/PorQ family protein [Ignavibacteriaceae bacterium]